MNKFCLKSKNNGCKFVCFVLPKLKTKNYSLKTTQAFSLVEILLSVALFAVFATGVIALITQGWSNNRLAGENAVAKSYASEGIEAIRSIANQNFATLASTASTGVLQSGGLWTLSGTNNTFDSGKYTRAIAISDVYRDGSGNVVASGGTIDSLTKKITSTVTWNFGPTRSETTTLVTYLTNWRSSFAAPKKNGMLVYGDGGTTTDAIKYQTYDATAGTWGTAASAADIDASTNRYLRAAKLYSSATRNEKVLISRHYDGTTQYIYGQVWNGSTWGNVTLLSSWASTAYLDVQNFDGSYLANGNFIVVYSNNTTTPLQSVWNGSAWSAGPAMLGLGNNNIPVYVLAEVRPGTNEVMAGFSTQGTNATTSNTVFQYYSGSAWSLVTIHANSSPDRTKKTFDFAWSAADPTKGAVVYAKSSADKAMGIRIWTADGLGSGSWGTASNYGTAQSNNLGTTSITPVTGSTNFIACDKDSLNPPRFICMRANTTGWVAASNVTVIQPTDPGIQQSFAVVSEPDASPLNVISVFSDNSTTAKLKKFTISTNTWDAAATSINSSAVGVIKTARAYSNLTNNNIIFLFADANLDLFTAGYDTTTDALISTGGLAWTAHGVSGSATTDFWYDFAWDNF